MQLVIQNQYKGPASDCVALTTKLEVLGRASGTTSSNDYSKLQLYIHFLINGNCRLGVLEIYETS
jgi:hypothetical protein